MYNLGIMDKALGSAREKNTVAEVSKENDGKVVSTAAKQLFTDKVKYRIEQ